MYTLIYRQVWSTSNIGKNQQVYFQPNMAKIPKPIFACFGIKKLCQFWLFQSLPNSATHFGINSGSFYMLMFAIFGNNFHYFILLHISLHCGFWFSDLLIVIVIVIVIFKQGVYSVYKANFQWSSVYITYIK